MAAQPSQAFRNPDTFSAITEATTMAAETFVNEFYTMLDSDRISFTNVFRADSKFIWDGYSCPMSDLQKFLAATPLTNHTKLSFDAQPVLLGHEDNDQSSLYPTPTIIVTAQGDLKYGLAEFKQGFQHTFILKRDPTHPAESQLFYCYAFNARSHKEVLSMERPRHNQNQNQRGGGGR